MDTPPTSHDTSHSLNKPTIGVLLVHGLNGGRRDFAELELALQDRGMLTNNMLLPGHGTHIREVLSLGWQDWADAVRAELIALKQRCDVVFIVGHSLGGSLTLHIAAHEEVDAYEACCKHAAIFANTADRIAKGNCASAGYDLDSRSCRACS